VKDSETAAACTEACAGATTGDRSADKLAGIRQVCPHNGRSLQADPVEFVTGLRQHEWWEPVGQQLIVRGAGTVTAGNA